MRLLKTTLLAGLATCAAHISDAAANPFIDSKPAPSGAAAEQMFALPFMQDIMGWQRQIHDAMTAQIEALHEGATLAPLWGLLLVSFAYGVFHVLAPGHGKVIVSSYFLGNHARWMDGVVAGLIMAVGHTVTAVAIVLGLYLVLGLTQLGVLAQARYIELLGYGLITAIGLWLVVRSFKPDAACGCGHDHGHQHEHEHHHGDHHDHAQHNHAHHDHAPHGHDAAHVHVPVHKNKRALSLFAATSMVPCTGSMIILLFTLANHVLWAGVLGVVAIALGMWLTVTAIGVVTILTRHMIIGNETTQSGARRLVMLGLNLLAALVVTLTGFLLCLGTWQSLGQ